MEAHLTIQAIKTTTEPEIPWRPQQGETLREFFAFIWWSLADGPLDQPLAIANRWTARRQALESFESLQRIGPGQEIVEAAIARVRVTLIEISKLQRAAVENPDNVMEVSDIMRSIEWMTQHAEAYAARQERARDFSRLNPDERETVMKAFQILERLDRET